MQKIDLRSILAPAVFILSLSLLSWQDSRTEFIFNFTVYGVSIISYLVFIRSQNFTHRQFLFVAIAAHLIFLFSMPAFSNDLYRFIWDGELINAGINPYDFTPSELIGTEAFRDSSYWQEIYNGMSPLSRKNYSCYPIVSQIYFAVSGFFSNSIIINLITLRILILSTYALCYSFLLRILELLDLEKKRIWILFLNPLWIIETIGNLHFEGVMISFMIAAVYFLLIRKLVAGSLLLTAAIQVKLIPVLILPFFFRYLGNVKASLLYLLVVIFVSVTSIILLDQGNILHFTESLLLYFRTFEFNSFFFHYYMEYGYWRYGWWRGKAYSFNLSNIVIFFIALLSLYGEIDNGKLLLKRFLLAFSVYLMLSTTVHPWYILPLLAFSIFSDFAYPLIWTFLVFLSYSAYANEIIDDGTFRLLVAVEYIGVLAIWSYELFSGNTLMKYLRLEKVNTDQ